VWFIDRIDFFNFNAWLGDETGAKVKLDLPTDIWLEAHQDWFVVKLRSAWSVNGQVHAPDTVLGISLSAFLDGDRNFNAVFEPRPRRALQGFFWGAGRLVLPILDELRPLSKSGRRRRRLDTRSLRGSPGSARSTSGVSMPTRAKAMATCLPTSRIRLTPSSLSLIEGFASPTLLKQAPRTFTADGLVVTQHEAISIDGERIPYVQTGPSTETGDAPVYMSAYGGFGLAVRPYYNSALGKPGSNAAAHDPGNIRGGGEFGTRWHDAGRLAGKRLSHDDFAAVAADLVRRGVTRPDRIAAEGGSNGGILISNMLTRYPERFGALFCTIPLIDMRRYTKAPGWRELDRGVWRSRQAGGMGLAAKLIPPITQRSRNRNIRRS